MKVDPSGSLRSNPLRRRSGGEGRGDGHTFARELRTDEASAGSFVTPGAAIAQLEGLLAVQEAGGRDQRRRAIRHADALLDELHDLKVALLAGQLPAATLQKLNALVGERVGVTDDPNLQALLAEVELRARVELAKLRG